MTETYIELHARSAFSFLQGASVPEELAQTAANLGYPAMAYMARRAFIWRRRKPASARTLERRSRARTDFNIRCWWRAAPGIRICAAWSPV
jgi:error-prone DNA polymerase